MLFSILIANYNNAPYLKECFDSILKQTYREIEVVFVDDCSTDNSLEIFNQFKNEFHSFQLHQNTINKGCGYTKHKSCELATGEVLGFLDPDDTITTEAVDLMIEAHKTNPKASVIYSTHYRCDEHLNIIEQPNNIRALLDNKSYLQDEVGVVTAFATFKKNLYLKSRKINPNYNRAVDQSLYYALDEVGEFIYIDKPIYLYRIHAGGISGASDKYLRAKHWALKAMTESYYSRIKHNLPKNISKRELDQRKAELNLKWIDYFASEKLFKKMYCNLIHGLINYPKQNIILKLKYLLYPLKIK